MTTKNNEIEKEDEYEPIRDNPNNPQNYPREFNLSEKMERYEEPIERAEIEHVVRQAHMKAYNDSSSYCNGCVERAISETIEKCKEDVKEAVRLLNEEAKMHKNPECKNGLTWTELINKIFGDKLI